MQYKNCLLVVKLSKMNPQWSLIVEAWSRGCGYTEYLDWCARDWQDPLDEPLDEDLFNVVYEALQEEFLHETEQIPEEPCDASYF